MVLVYKAPCRSNPMWYRYRVEPEALISLQCAVDAAILLRPRVRGRSLAMIHHGHGHFHNTALNINYTGHAR